MKFGPLIFLNCESTCDFTDGPASIFDQNMNARPFDTLHDMLRFLSFVESLIEDRNAPIWRKGEPTHLRLPVRTDRLGDRIFEKKLLIQPVSQPN